MIDIRRKSMTLYKKTFGKTGEDIAFQYLIDRDFTIIDRNFRSKFGEIDIIAQKGNKLFFIEVKTRANLNKGKPHEAVTPHKIHQLQKASTYFLLQNTFKNYRYSIGVISILLQTQDDYQLKFFESIE